MEEQLISFETAKLAKEKGFNWKVKNYCTDSKPEINRVKDTDGKLDKPRYNIPFVDFNQFDKIYSKPTQSLLQKWLREIHKIDVLVSHQFQQEDNTSVLYDICITTGINNTDSENYCNYGYDKLFNTYEEALGFGLQEALKLIKV